LEPFLRKRTHAHRISSTPPPDLCPDWFFTFTTFPEPAPLYSASAASAAAPNMPTPIVCIGTAAAVLELVGAVPMADVTMAEALAISEGDGLSATSPQIWPARV
jgi:hypothetical protein